MQVAVLLTLHNKQQQPDARDALVPCTAAMLAAAAAVLDPQDSSNNAAALQLQLAKACISAGLLQPLATALRKTSVDLNSADAAVAAALATAGDMPVQYRPLQPMPSGVRLALALLQLFHALAEQWPGGLLTSAQAAPVALPATELLRAGMRLGLRLLAAGRKDLSCKLLQRSAETGLFVGLLFRPLAEAQNLTQSSLSSDNMSAAELQLVCSAPLHELQLLLLSLAVKTQLHEQLRGDSSGGRSGSSSSTTSGSVRRQQQRQQSLSAEQQPHLLAMLQACGLSSEQAAAAPWPPAVTAVTCLSDKVVFSKVLASFVRCSDYARSIVEKHLRQQEHQLHRRHQQEQQQRLSQVQQQQQQQLVEQQQQMEQQQMDDGCSTEALLRVFFTMSFPAALMLLEAGMHTFQSDKFYFQ
jgi:hypothetical protein